MELNVEMEAMPQRILFLKEGTKSANTPPFFLDYLRKKYPVLLEPSWRFEQIQEIKSIYSEGRVLVGQKGFGSLSRSHWVVEGNGVEIR